MTRIVHRSARRASALAALVLLAVATSGCSESPGDQVSIRITPAGMTIDGDVPRSGRVRFAIDNETDKTHHLVMIPGSDPSAVALTPEGAVDLAANRPADEIDDLRPGYFVALSPNTRAGDYLWVCTIVEGEGEQRVSHFKAGMYAPFSIVPRRAADPPAA